MRILYHARKRHNVYMLDLFSDAIGAYSFRKLSSTYTGYCVRIYRASDATYLDVGFVNDYIDIQAVSDFIGSEDASCWFWYSQTGDVNADVDSSPYPNRGPDIMEGGTILQENNKIYANFIGDREALGSPPYNTVNSEISIFTVAKLTTVDNANENPLAWQPYRFWIGADKDGLIMSKYGDGSSWGQTTPNSSESWLNSWKLVTTINDGNDNQFINGQTITARSNAMTGYTGGWSFGSMARNPIINWRGRVMEIILFNSDKSAEREAIESNINSFYSIY